MSSPNALCLGDEVWCQLPWGLTPFRVVVTRLDGRHVHVSAVRRSDDPLATNDHVVRFRNLSRERPDARRPR